MSQAEPHDAAELSLGAPLIHCRLAERAGISQAAPGSELGRVQPFATQQCADLLELDGRIRPLHNPQLVGPR